MIVDEAVRLLERLHDQALPAGRRADPVLARFAMPAAVR